LPRQSDPSRLGALRIEDVEWLSKDNGPLKPVPVPGTERLLAADLALLAMGFVGPELGRLLTPDELKPDSLGRLTTTQDLNQGLSQGLDLHGLYQGLYLGGDALTGPSLVVRAINSGVNLAATILADYRAANGRLSAA
jgi:glutamate synthase (NADPH/NADH) small chain